MTAAVRFPEGQGVLGEGKMHLEADGCQATVDLQHGGRLASLTVDGWEILATQGKDVYHWGSFVLAPWTGRLRHGRFRHAGREHQMPLTLPPHALHGLVVDRPWQSLGPGIVGIELDPPWPWRGRLIHSMTLEPGRLVSRLELIADDEMPAALGWHPWFPRDLMHPDGARMGPIELSVEPGRMYVNDEEGLPSGELVAPVARPWDYCFVDLAAPPRLGWHGEGGRMFELTVTSDCPCWVIYDQEPQALCVEPWTAPPNSLNLPSPTLVRPGEPLVATMTWRWHVA